MSIESLMGNLFFIGIGVFLILLRNKFPRGFKQLFHQSGITLPIWIEKYIDKLFPLASLVSGIMSFLTGLIGIIIDLIK